MVQAQGLTDEWLKRAKLALEKGDEEVHSHAFPSHK